MIENSIITELAEIVREFFSVISVEELPNRNRLGIDSIIFLCVMVSQASSRAYQKHVRAFMRTLANSGELWRTHNATCTRTSLTFTRVPAKVPHIHQSSGEGACCVVCG